MLKKKQQQQKIHNKNETFEFNPEDFIFPSMMKSGLGHICEYCITKAGYSVTFTSLRQYLEHVLYNHEGYSVYAFDEDLERFAKETGLETESSYKKKLQDKMKQELYHSPFFPMRRQKS